MSKLGNRQAFPHSIQTSNGRITDIEGGITIRQYMATQFMSEYLDMTHLEIAAQQAVRAADELLKALEEAGQ